VRRKALIYSIVAMMLFPGCGGKSGSIGQLQDDLGHKLPALPAGGGVVSLAPNTTELIIWLGAILKLKGVTRYCRVLASAAELRIVGSMLKPDLERISLLKPDLALLSFEGNPPALAASLRRLSIPVYVIRIETVSGLYASLQRLASVLNLKIDARLRKLKQRVAALKDRLKGQRVLFHIPGGRSVFTFGTKTLLGDLLLIAGAENAGAELSGRFPRVSPERLATLQIKTAVILTAPNTPAASTIRTLWKRLSPDTKLVFSAEAAFFRPGPGLVRALASLVDQL